MMKVKEEPIGSGIYVFYCVACKDKHVVHTTERNHSGAIWTYNGDANNPTFTPSINRFGETMDGEIKYRCHSHVTNGKIQYCDDCTHGYGGTTVEIPEI